VPGLLLPKAVAAMPFTFNAATLPLDSSAPSAQGVIADFGDDAGR